MYLPCVWYSKGIFLIKNRTLIEAVAMPTLDNPHTSASPHAAFFLKGGDVGVFLIHGFTASIYDMRELGAYLHSKGYSAYGLRIAGHGKTVDALAKTTRHDWYESAVAGLSELKNSGVKKVFLIGYSFGANLAMHLAAHHNGFISGVACISPSVFIRRERVIRALLPFVRPFKRYYKKRLYPDTSLEEYLASGAYDRIPLKTMVEFFGFIDEYTKPDLSQVKQPMLLIQSRRDRIVDPKSIAYLEKHLGSSHIKTHWIDSAGHNPRELGLNRVTDMYEMVEGFMKDSMNDQPKVTI